jgi:hypothetical protein
LSEQTYLSGVEDDRGILMVAQPFETARRFRLLKAASTVSFLIRLNTWAAEKASICTGQRHHHAATILIDFILKR